MGAWALNENQRTSKEKRGWKELFWKPETRDEKIKEYVPDVLEESLAAQRAVLSAEQTNRDRIVEAGHKVMKELENKAPIPSIYPAVVEILKLYGSSDNVISQRALNYLLYPSSASFAGQAPHELVGGFHDNFKQLIETVEANGTVVTPAPATPAIPASSTAPPAGEAGGKNEAAPNAKPTSEAPELTYFVKCLTGMCLANVQIGDLKNAVACVDAALPHAIVDSRRAGLLALKAGVLNKMKKYDLAVASARLAIEASPANAQAYLQGAAALRLLKHDDEAIAMLESGALSCPTSDAIRNQLAAVQKTAQLSLPQTPNSSKSLPEGAAAQGTEQEALPASSGATAAAV